MKKSLTMLVLNPAFWVQLTLASLASAQTVDQVIPHKVKLESVEYLGKHAVKITEDGQVADGEAYAIVKGSTFHNGAIEVELAGRPAAGAGEGARGFIGIRSEEHTSELQSHSDLVCRLLLEKKRTNRNVREIH